MDGAFRGDRCGDTSWNGFMMLRIVCTHDLWMEGVGFESWAGSSFSALDLKLVSGVRCTKCILLSNLFFEFFLLLVTMSSPVYSPTSSILLGRIRPTMTSLLSRPSLLGVLLLPSEQCVSLSGIFQLFGSQRRCDVVCIDT